MQHQNDIMARSPLLRRFSAPTLEEATWTCDQCGVIAGKALTFTGSLRYVKNQCACQIAELQRKNYDERRMKWVEWQKGRTFSWLGDKWDDRSLLHRTFETFDQSAQQNAYDTVQAFIMDMCGTLVLHGSYGTGKTHLLAALCNELRNVGKGSLFTTAPDLFAAIQSRIATNQDYSEIIRVASDTALLVIDDIDKAKLSEFKEDIYIQIVNRRVNAHKPIAISTNKLHELEKYVGGAVCSRFKMGQIAVEMLGLDYRETMEIA